MSEIAQLTDRQAITAVHALVVQWCEARGVEPLVAWQALNQASPGGLPGPLAAYSEDDPTAAAICRKVLEVVIDGENPDARRWAAGAVSAARQPKGQIFDPISLAIIGATAIGLVLAVRVKRIGPVQFYEGLPEGTDKVVGATAKAMAGIPPS